ncbi:YidB family protein [Polaromonas sp. UC242_47]|uniref:YidB family protein n=1 Tax=Polaromonas sp. UC242_47 TaxID=3374626 RepID=UPI00379759FC
MLSNDSPHGGLGGLLQKFQQAGLGDVAGSWVGSGQNQPISGEQLSQVLGPDTMSGLAEKLGVAPGEAAGQLSNILPGLIDHLTPQGQAPEQGLGNAGDLMGMLGGLLNKR